MKTYGLFSGSPSWTRTNDPAVNSRMLYQCRQVNHYETVKVYFQSKDPFCCLSHSSIRKFSDRHTYADTLNLFNKAVYALNIGVKHTCCFEIFQHNDAGHYLTVTSVVKAVTQNALYLHSSGRLDKGVYPADTVDISSGSAELSGSLESLDPCVSCPETERVRHDIGIQQIGDILCDNSTHFFDDFIDDLAASTAVGLHISIINILKCIVVVDYLLL